MAKQKHSHHQIPICRKPIPALPEKEVRIGTIGSVRRSFDGVEKNPIRLYAGETLSLTIEFAEPITQAEVSCYTNLNRKDHSWRPLKFKRKGNLFHFSLRADNCGVFGFRVKYSFDNGHTWIWDRMPPVRVHVDPRSMRDVRSYTLIPTVSGTVSQWIEMLDHIEQMGFNMVHLLPITQMDRSESPYSAKDLFALDPSYLDNNKTDGLKAFEEFVQVARQRNIALCVDLVLNHLGPGSHVSRRAPEYIMTDRFETDGMQRSGCWHMNQWLKWNDLVRIHYAHPDHETKQALWDYMAAYAIFWANYAACTGGMVRLDNLHNSDEHFIGFVLEKLRKTYPDLIIHAEFFSDSNTVLKVARQWDINLFLANLWEYPYAENLREYLLYCHEIGDRVRHHMPVTTHDTGAPSELFGDPRAVVPRYFIAALMSTGQTGWVQGAEQGVAGQVQFIGRHRSISNAIDKWIVDRISKINRVLRDHDILRTPGNLQFVDGDHGALVGAWRSTAHSDCGILLLSNLDTRNFHRLSLDLWVLTGNHSHQLTDLLDGAAPFDAGSRYEVELAPLGVAAFLLRGNTADSDNDT